MNSVRSRLWLVVSIPLLCLAIAAGFVATAALRDAAAVGDLRILGEAAPRISAFVHELQKERGNSAGFIGAKGAGDFPERLRLQYAATDTVQPPFLSALDRLDTADLSDGLERKIARSREILAGHAAMRRKVQALEIEAPAAADFYSGLIASLLDVIGEMAVRASEPRMANSIGAYIAFLQMKERNGIERATGSNGFAAGQFSPAIFRRFAGVIAQQDAFLVTFRTYATDEQEALFESTVSGPDVDEVTRLRGIAVKSIETGSTEAVKATHWFDTITRKINLMKQVEDAFAAQIQETAADLERRAWRRALVTSAALAAIVAGVGLLLVRVLRTLLDPIRQMTQSMVDVAAGRPFASANGMRLRELAEMMGALGILADAKAKADALAARGAEELARETARQGRIAELSHQLSGTVGQWLDRLSDMGEEIRQAARNMTETAGASRNDADHVEKVAHEASGDVQTVAAAVEELSYSISAISGDVSRSEEIIRTAVDSANRATGIIESLAGATERIGAVSELISQIAQQTNLLALNATIEAARAGEAGKGFAVVASEVKGLAGQTERATKEIGDQITQIQQAAETSVSAISAVAANVAAINDIAASIAHAVREQDGATREIARSLTRTAEHTGEVVTTIAQVSTAVARVETTAGNLFASADALVDTSTRLESETKRFIANLEVASRSA